MPNWVFNKVHFIGDKKEIERLKTFVTSDSNGFDFDNIIPMPSYIYRGNLGIEEERKYGKNNWYDWSIDNWGTKWNSVDVLWNGDDFVSFSTAWSMPEGIYRELAKKFPKLLIEIQYADEDLGHNCGSVELKNGNMTLDYIDNFEFACDVWGYDPMDFVKEEEYEDNKMA